MKFPLESVCSRQLNAMVGDDRLNALRAWRSDNWRVYLCAAAGLFVSPSLLRYVASGSSEDALQVYESLRVLFALGYVLGGMNLVVGYFGYLQDRVARRAVGDRATQETA